MGKTGAETEGSEDGRTGDRSSPTARRRGPPEQSTDGTESRDASESPPTARRREVLAGLSVTGLASLAGCSVSVDDDGISWSSTAAATPTRTAPPRTTTQRPAQTARPTATSTPTATPAPTPAETTTEQELELLTANVQPQQYELITPRPTPTATATPTPEPVTARFGLHNFRLYVVKAGDGLFEGPDSLELKGWVVVRGYDGRGNRIGPVNISHVKDIVWSVVYPNTFDVDEGERAKKLSTATDPVFVDFPNFGSLDPSRAYIEVSGDFTDSDGVADDDLGDGSVKWALDGPQSGGATSNRNGEARFSFSVKGDDAHVRVSFDVDRFA